MFTYSFINSKRKLSLLFLFLALAAVACYGQVKNLGTPFIRSYSSVDYGMHPRNYTITQDSNGLIYIGNEYGLLEYDGSEWRQIHLPKGINVTMISIDKAGQFWLGSEEGIGSWQRSKQNAWSYKKLQLPNSVSTPFTIAGIYQIKESLFLTTEKQILKYKTGQSLKSFFLSDKTHIQFTKVLDDRLLLKTKGGDLLSINPEDGSKKVFAKGFVSYNVIDLVPFGEGTLAITANNGLWTVNKGKMKPFEIDFSSLINQDRLTSAIALKNGNFAVGSYHSGVFVFDKEGHLVHHISKKKGLNSNTVNFLFESSDQNLWVALDNGLAYIELNSAFTKYDELMGFNGMIYTSIVYQGKLYLGTTQGLFVSEWEESNVATGLQFKAVDGIEGQVWALYNTGSQLLCGHETGVFEINDKIAIRRSNSSRVWTFLESEKYPGTLFAGTLSGIEVFKKEASNYTFSHKLKGFQESSRIIEEDFDGTLWVCHGNKGLFHISLSDKALEVASEALYEPTDPAAEGLWFTSVVKSKKNGILFSSNFGLYSFDKTNKSFIPFKENSLIPKERFVNRVYEDKFGNLWLMIEGGLLLMKLQEDGTYKLLDETFLSKARNVMIGSYEHIYVYDAQNVLIAAQNGVLHLDPAFFKKQHLVTGQKSIPTLIRRIVVTRPSDSIIFEGALSAEQKELANASSQEQLIKLPYAKNSIRFTYATPTFTSDGNQQYQFLLKKSGYNSEEAKWSSWTTANQKEYTNLREGDYIFHVRGSKGLNNVNSEAKFTFTISPPWYRTFWAYGVYLLLIGGVVVVLVKIMERRHNKEKERLREANVREMKAQQLLSEKEMIELKNAKLSEEIAFKNKEMASVVMQITQKNEFLKQLKNKLKQITETTEGSVKNDLLANIKEIDRDMRLDKNWEKFQFYFDQVHQDFLERLRAEFPHLSSTTLKLCAFIRIGLSTKEIAVLMNISLSGVEKRRYRLRKKLHLDPDINLTSFLKDF